MSGTEGSAKDSKDVKKPDTLQASTSSSGSAVNLGLSNISGLANPSSMSLFLAPDREEDDSQDVEGIERSLRQMGIRPPRPFDPKKDRNFESWLNQIKFYF